MDVLLVTAACKTTDSKGRRHKHIIKEVATGQRHVNNLNKTIASQTGGNQTSFFSEARSEQNYFGSFVPCCMLQSINKYKNA